MSRPPSPRHLDQRLKIRHLRVIEAVARHASLVKAAGALAMTQPALTRALHEIEAILQLRLYDRHPRGVAPTAYGAAAAAAAAAVLAELEKFDETLDRLQRAEAGTLAIGALPVAAVGVLPGVLARLSAERESVQVRLVQGATSELLPALASGAIDLMVGRLYEPAAADGLVREALYDEDFVLFARSGHPMAAAGLTAEAAVQSYRLVLPTITQRVGQEIAGLMARLPPPAEAPVRSTSIGFIRAVLQESDMITIVPRSVMADDLRHGLVRETALPFDTALRPAGLIYRADPPPHLSALIDDIRRFIADGAGGPARAAA
jgi:LysR family pca operon transcriptional activator